MNQPKAFHVFFVFQLLCATIMQVTWADELQPLVKTAQVPAVALTTGNPNVPIEELKFLIRPLTKDELAIEAESWFGLLKRKVHEISTTEIDIRRRKEAASQSKGVAEDLSQAKAALRVAEERLEKNPKGSNKETDDAIHQVESARDKVRSAEMAVQSVVKKQGQEVKEDITTKNMRMLAENTAVLDRAKERLDEVIKIRDKMDVKGDNYQVYANKVKVLDVALNTAMDATNEINGITEKSPDQDKIKSQHAEAIKVLVEALKPLEDLKDTKKQETSSAEAIQEVVANLSDDTQNTSLHLESLSDKEGAMKLQMVNLVTDLQSQRTALIDHLQVVLDEWEIKGGDSTPYRLYIKAVGATVEIDLSDSEGLAVRLLGWLNSTEGGLRWGKNSAIFIGTFFALLILSRILAIIATRGLSVIHGEGSMLQAFIKKVIRRGGVIIAFLFALASIEVNLTPLLALIGGLGFILAFALQSNIGNMASGMLLMVYKPFEIGDEVKIADVWGTVRGINLAGTIIDTFTNEKIMIPNSTVWTGVINNKSGNSIRGFELTFRVDYDVPLEKIQQVFQQVCKSNPLVLEGDDTYVMPWNYITSAVELVAFVSSKTEDFWEMQSIFYSEFKDRCLAEGIDLVDYQEINLHPKEKA